MSEVKVSAPWFTLFREIEALFKEDPNVHVEYDDGKKVITVFVYGAEKADALTQLLPTEKVFGNVTVQIVVKPSNVLKGNKTELFQKAFEGNGAFSCAVSCDSAYMSNPITFVVFKKKVVQFWNDELFDIHGNVSTLYQEIAKDVFDGVGGVFFCTDDK